MPTRPLISTVWLDDRAAAVIQSEAAARPRLETGGALFGFGAGEELVVACAYGPGPRAKHRRSSFEPHRQTTDALIRAVWRASDRRYRYLGSWHTHPGGSARPSGTDIHTIESVAKDAAVRLPRPLVLIQATRLSGASVSMAELRAWHWSTGSEWLLPCELESTLVQQRICPTVTVPAGRMRKPQVLRSSTD
jgi:integrative and conjugative element protein (TIGR02256 family)